MKKFINATIIGLSVMIPAQGARIIDQMQPNIIITSPTTAVGGGSEQKIAQTITIGKNGVLKGVYLPIGCSTGKLRITVTDLVGNEPGNFVYTSKQVRASRITNPVSTFRYFGLPGNLDFIVGDQITLILENETGSCGIASGPTGNIYPDGVGFFDARPNQPGWIPIFGPGYSLDIPFMLVLKTP